MKLSALLAIFGLIVAIGAVSARPSPAQTAPRLVDPALRLSTVVSGLALPTSIAFLGENDLLVLEKDTGRVVRVTNGVDRGAVLDLSVNNFPERGLLGIALHPDFPADPGVYLYWTCRSTAPLDDDPFTPEERECSSTAMFGPDTNDVLRVPLLGNRVDRFVWKGSGLTFDRDLTSFLPSAPTGSCTSSWATWVAEARSRISPAGRFGAARTEPGRTISSAVRPRTTRTSRA